MQVTPKMSHTNPKVALGFTSHNQLDLTHLQLPCTNHELCLLAPSISPGFKFGRPFDTGLMMKGRSRTLGPMSWSEVTTAWSVIREFKKNPCDGDSVWERPLSANDACAVGERPR
jgi:hypothetical protein